MLSTQKLQMRNPFRVRGTVRVRSCRLQHGTNEEQVTLLDHRLQQQEQQRQKKKKKKKGQGVIHNMLQIKTIMLSSVLSLYTPSEIEHFSRMSNYGLRGDRGLQLGSGPQFCHLLHGLDKKWISFLTTDYKNKVKDVIHDMLRIRNKVMQVLTLLCTRG